MRLFGVVAALVALAGCPQDEGFRCEPCHSSVTRYIDASSDDAFVDPDAGDAGVVDAPDAGTDDELTTCYEACNSGEDPATCDPQPVACVLVCDAAHPCPDEGHPCVAYRKTNICSFDCVSTACGARRECRGRDCQDVDCGEIVPCLSSADICDPVAHRCYPFDGRCSSVDDCPVYDMYWTSNALLSCAGGYCSVGLRPLLPPPDLGPVPPVGVISPMAGTNYLDENALVVQWASDFGGNDASTIILIVDGYPQSKYDLENHAVWGAALRPGETGPIMLSAGQLVSQGTWTGQPGPLPHNRLLTLVVEVVRSGQLLAVSNVVPFSIGQAWPARGDFCNPNDGAKGCASPTEVMSCHPLTYTCERVCGSYRDCSGFSPARDCGAPRELTRYCE